MGNLKPGATYVYETADGVTYAREFGAPAYERFEIGRSVDRTDLDDHNEWIKIRYAGKTNPALQKAIDRVKIIYRLSQEKYGR